ncbi:MAG: adenylate/guanylate cyclase domain-containing protein [Victivallales bacterium]|jgi:class 3 adenylate cyclase
MNERILVVDDTPANIQALSGILRGAGYQLSVATDGMQALNVLSRIRPDLILLDVMMPGIDGFETCDRIKKTADCNGIPVIFLTAKTEVADIVRGFEVGAVDYVAKPFNAHELLARVNTHITLDRLNRENQRLLLNVLPPRIAESLKKQTGIIAERFEDASVLFADIVGFTPMAESLSPVELVELLNRIFSAFDELAKKHSLEKIKTIGDAYMIAGGLPEAHPDHLQAMARMALEMIETTRQFTHSSGGVTLRIGLHVGDVVAGVIGTHKFIYDIWGSTVNIASRLESHGAPGRIHVSETVFLRLNKEFTFEARGSIELKGRGMMNTFFLNAVNAAPS